jgi:hypothetical protein
MLLISCPFSLDLLLKGFATIKVSYNPLGIKPSTFPLLLTRTVSKGMLLCFNLSSPPLTGVWFKYVSQSISRFFFVLLFRSL